MFNEVVKALVLKFDIEGMEVENVPLSDSLSEWIGFKNKKETLYFRYPKITENGLKYERFIYEVKSKRGNNIEITVLKNKLSFTTYQGYVFNLETDESINLLERSPKEIFSAVQKVPEIDFDCYDGIYIFMKIINLLSIPKIHITNAMFDNLIEIKNKKIKMLRRRKEGCKFVCNGEGFNYSEKTYELQEKNDGTFDLTLHGTQEEIETAQIKDLIKKARERINSFRQEIEKFNSNK